MKNNHQWVDVEPKMIGLWQECLLTLTNISDKAFNHKHQPCPVCGGKDRFRFDDNRHQKGDGGAICSQCGSGPGIYWLMKITGMGFLHAVNACGDFLGQIPQERIVVAKKQINTVRVSDYSLDMPHERVIEFIARYSDMPLHPYTMFNGIAPYPLMQLNGYIAVPMMHTDKFPSHNQEVADIATLCNIALFDNDGTLIFPEGIDELHPRGRMSFGAFSPIGKNTGQAIYLCADWIDSWHAHYATGSQIWCCYNKNNLDHIAWQFYLQCMRTELRMAVNIDYDELCEAEKNNCKVIIPDGDNKIKKARKFIKALYNPTDILNELIKNNL